jgi:hypothetical protein
MAHVMQTSHVISDDNYRYNSYFMFENLDKYYNVIAEIGQWNVNCLKMLYLCVEPLVLQQLVVFCRAKGI